MDLPIQIRHLEGFEFHFNPVTADMFYLSALEATQSGACEVPAVL